MEEELPAGFGLCRGLTHGPATEEEEDSTTTPDQVASTMIFDRDSQRWACQDMMGAWRYAEPEGQILRDMWIDKKIQVFLQWNESRGWVRIDVFPVSEKEYPWFHAFRMGQAKYVQGDPQHITVCDKNQMQSLDEDAKRDLGVVRDFVLKRSRDRKWRTTLLIRKVRGLTHRGGHVALLAEGWPFRHPNNHSDSCLEELKRLRKKHHGN